MKPSCSIYQILTGGSLAVIALASLAQPAKAQQTPSSDASQTEASPAATTNVTAASPATALPTPGEEANATDGIVITGSRLSNSGFLAPTPVTIVGAAEIARQGVTNVAEVLNEVPAFRPQNTPTTSSIFISNIGASTADLRGLGANRTLVLINGRRVVASTTGGGSFTPANTVDLNLVPTALIERTEVVTGGASAAYGSDAVAGVVNLILNTKLEGLRGSAQYGQTESSDAKDYAASFAYGTKIGSRGHFILGVDYDQNKGTGDCYARSWCAQASNTVTNPLYRTNGLPAQLVLSNTTTSTSSLNGLITSGPLAGTEFASDGSTHKHNYGTYYGAGIFQSGGGDGVQPFYQFFPISTPVERISTFAHGNYDLSDSITAFVEGSYARVNARSFGAQVRELGSLTIRPDNPFLPPAVATALGTGTAQFGRIGDDLGPGVGIVHRETYRGVAGLNGKLGGNWKWNLYYQYGRTNYDQSQSNDKITSHLIKAFDAVRNSAGQIVCRVNADASTANDDPACAPINLFGQNNSSAASRAYVFGTATQYTHLTQNVISGDVQGDLFSTWAGPVSVAFGGEHRSDTAHGDADPISKALDFYTSPGSSIDGSINVNEGFFEAGVPLARDLPFARSLDLNGAVRYTDYSTSGGVTSWKLGGTWEPVSQIRFRATRSRDIRAPNVFELYSPVSSSFQLINDPNKSGAAFLTQTLLGGNAALKPEVALTWTGGVVLSPDFWGLNRLRLSVDYYDIALKGAISTLGAQVVVNLCSAGQSALCPLVTRDAGGNLVSVANLNLNLNQLVTRGIDIEASYTLPLSDVSSSLNGSLSFRALATHVSALTTTTPTGSVTNRAGQDGSSVSQPSGVPSWSASQFITYVGSRFSAEAQLRFISAGRRDVTLIGPDQAGYATTLPNSTSNNRVPAYYYVNVNAQYALIDKGDQRVELFAAINNLFDKDPPNAPSSFGPTNPVLYDVLGRTFRAGIRFAY